jgi:hypothetical protein
MISMYSQIAPSRSMLVLVFRSRREARAPPALIGIRSRSSNFPTTYRFFNDACVRPGRPRVNQMEPAFA